ncbi:unnamed protein product [Candidula unifasciata]|uniref:SOCS box domain-containing protein n=1 Tax=Candidula unifasciata TaxID=100452 RepID=A0A8S3YYX1_9EUPU|nr:unnamed protein product [Candidula unifasciata]
MEDAIRTDDYSSLRSLFQQLSGVELEAMLFKACDFGAENCAAILLNKGVEKDCVNNSRMTPLMHAVKAQSLEVTKLLVTWGCEVNTLLGTEGNSALHIAAEAGNEAICEVLIAAGANVNARNDKEDTPLIVASVSGHLPIVKLLLNHHASVNRRGYHESSALHEATENGHYEICSYLITAKAGLEDEDTFGNTPLICAAEKGHVNLVLLYLALGADVNRVSHSGITALHYAAKKGWAACCKALLHHGAEIDAQDIRRFTPLMMASLEGHKEVIQLILDAKCNVNMVAYNRRTALHYAAEQGYSSCCQILIEAGANIETFDSDKCTPVMLAGWKGNLETLKFLIDSGANLHHWSRHVSILHLAAEGGSIECCNLLINHGVSINIRCCDGVTPLISAIRFFRMPVVDFFLNQGCSLEKLPSDDVTALNEAVYRDIDTSVIEKMLAHGASPNTLDRFHTLPLWHAIDNCNFTVIKLLLLCNSDYPMLSITHCVHKENPTLIRWLVAAYAEDAASLLRKMNSLYSVLNLEDLSIADLVSDLIMQPQSLLRQCRRSIRKRLGSGTSVNQKISALGLPSLLHNYMLFSDLELPSEKSSMW